jgi:PIN domain nuclease of toxin-antitoxin system
MNLLLDSHIILWWLLDSKDLTDKARKLIADTEHTIFCSAASIWEIRIKEALGKLELPRRFAEVLAEQSFEDLSVSIRHSHLVADLPLIHKDPFDRMLVAQARSESLTLVTHDPVFKKYPVECILV